MIVSQGHTIGVKEYHATDQEAEIVLLALQCFGHLIKNSGPFMALKRLTFSDLADRITAAYSLADARTAEVVRVLRTVNAHNLTSTER
ncbi:MAG TPA: hypothetical protein VF450_05445 [Noviherbaspirillum sp.]